MCEEYLTGYGAVWAVSERIRQLSPMCRKMLWTVYEFQHIQPTIADIATLTFVAHQTAEQALRLLWKTRWVGRDGQKHYRIASAQALQYFDLKTVRLGSSCPIDAPLLERKKLMITVVCKRSGLTFETDNARIKIHPEISKYTTHKDLSIRSNAIEVIEQGKAEGWSTIDLFINAIEAALTNESNPVTETYDWNGHWFARITGSNSTYRFQRQFMESASTKTVGKPGQKFVRNYFRWVDMPDGIFEGCYQSASKNQTRSYWRIESGVATGITLEEVERLYPPITEPQQVIPSVPPGAQVGELFEVAGQWYEVVSDSMTVPVSLKSIAERHLAGLHVGYDAIFDAFKSGYLTSSQAMNSDF